MFTKHEEKICPRCKVVFECKVGSIALCQCSAVTLTEDERNYLSEKYEDCLCAKCMMELQAEFHDQQ